MGFVSLVSRLLLNLGDVFYRTVSSNETGMCIATNSRGRPRRRTSTASDASRVVSKARYSSDSSVLWRIRRTPFEASSTLFLEESRGKLLPGDEPLPNSERLVVACHEVAPVRLSVRPRLVWILGPVSSTGRSGNMAGTKPPAWHLFCRVCHSLRVWKLFRD